MKIEMICSCGARISVEEDRDVYAVQTVAEKWREEHAACKESSPEEGKLSEATDERKE